MHEEKDEQKHFEEVYHYPDLVVEEEPFELYK
jgi:hypothetical protein